MHITPLIANNFLIFDKPAEDYTNRALGFVLYYFFLYFSNEVVRNKNLKVCRKI